MEQNNENVQIGSILDEKSYARDRKHINIDQIINIDFIRETNILHEVKKSRKIEEASIWQVKYYIYYLKVRGMEGVRGRIDYPLLKKSMNVELSEEDEDEMTKILDEIKKVISLPVPPGLINQKICKSCAYLDLCYI